METIKPKRIRTAWIIAGSTVLGAIIQAFGSWKGVLPALPPSEHQLESAPEVRELRREISELMKQLADSRRDAEEQVRAAVATQDQQIAALRTELASFKREEGARGSQQDAGNGTVKIESNRASDLTGIWDGRSVSGKGSISVVIELSEKKGGAIDGFVNIPEEGNVILKVTGKRITSVEDFIDRTRWENVGLPNSEKGTFFSLSTLSIVQRSYANGLPHSGIYKCMLSEEGIIRVAMFWYKDDARPRFILELRKRE